MKRKWFSIFSFPQSSPPEIILINIACSVVRNSRPSWS